MTYKTPDVYVEEISLFPPSVAEVETAVPAFIGYTEKAIKNGVDDVTKKPTRITSLKEYEEIFGGAPEVDITKVTLDSNCTVTDAQTSATFYMYDALRLFFNNGGGKCYIVSIGSYQNNKNGKNLDHFTQGIDELKKQDEPTIILFPDAVLLEDSLYAVQQHALKQCANLMDRVVILDLLESPDWKQGYEQFRTEIGINNLKYGAAYTPYLKTILPKKVQYMDIKGKLVKKEYGQENPLMLMLF
jgi:phage tail sheath protein FI